MQKLATKTRVHTRNSEIVADMSEDVGQWAWGKISLENLKAGLRSLRRCR